MVTDFCPVIQHADRVLDLSKSTAAALRKFRRSLQYCQSCPKEGVCPNLESLNSQIAAAIQDLTEEWNLYVG